MQSNQEAKLFLVCDESEDQRMSWYHISCI